MKTYYIALDCGDATVYAPNKNRAVINFFNYVHKSGQEVYSIKKEKGEFNIYDVRFNEPFKIDVTEVTEEGVITYVEH
jgi:hypothetical protein